jgi:hypothetical protein
MWHELGRKTLGSGLSTVVTPMWSHDHVSMSSSLARHWQTHLPDAMADNTSLLNQAHVQYQSSTGGSTVKKPAETQTSIRLASHLVRAPWRPWVRCSGNSVHWLKVERLLGSGLFHSITTYVLDINRARPCLIHAGILVFSCTQCIWLCPTNC